MITSYPAPTPRQARVGTPDDCRWLHAEPFRRQLFFVADATGLSGPVLAVVSRVPMRTVARLMTGRAGRIRVQDAHRLMALDPSQLRRAMVSPAEPSLVREAFERWLRRGGDPVELAHIAQLSRASIRACCEGASVTIPMVAWWRTLAALELGRHHDVRATPRETAARLAA